MTRGRTPIRFHFDELHYSNSTKGPREKRCIGDRVSPRAGSFRLRGSERLFRRALRNNLRSRLRFPFATKRRTLAPMRRLFARADSRLAIHVDWKNISSGTRTKSWKCSIQAMGRIKCLNTSFVEEDAELEKRKRIVDSDQRLP